MVVCARKKRGFTGEGVSDQMEMEGDDRGDIWSYNVGFL